MATNEIYIPELNPVLFFDEARANIPKYFTKHFENFPFGERLYFWQQPEEFIQVWQTTDIIFLQFESEFSPIVINLLDAYGEIIQEFPALIGLPNKFIPGKYSFEVGISLADLETSCYFLQMICGLGETQRLYRSTRQFVSEEPLENTLLLEYWHTRFHKDVLFETGIRYQIRILGVLGFLDKVRKDERYRDEKYNPFLLNSKSSKQWPVYFGIPGDGLLSQSKYYGLPDDIINVLEEIWSCNNVLIDGKPRGIADGSSPEYTVIDENGLYPKRGMKLTVEAGINRNSRIFSINRDTTKKLITSIVVEAAVFGDLAGQGSSNTVPNYNIVTQEE